ncbi:hypothetical protein LADH09A_005380 [Micromonospora sp. LAH09]|uniref:hypothetical protein n=1 Tax=Micromonospora cabrerizensis TaxID=2911213 RepID=UPI001EE95D7C|nr:hypothetical protein [Micromonospora cabrerizensis]MCG5471390.1 hypothetical protein [Micromonospora cabrerizensis]
MNQEVAGSRTAAPCGSLGLRSTTVLVGEAAKHLFDVVSGLITKLIDVLIVINLASAVGTATSETGIGPVVGYGVAAYYAWQAYDLYNEISTFYGNAEATFKGIAGTIGMIQAGAAIAALPNLETYQHPGQQG